MLRAIIGRTMGRKVAVSVLSAWMIMLFVLFAYMPTALAVTAPSVSGTYIFDEAQLLSNQEKADLNELAAELSVKHNTDLIIYTSKNPERTDVMKMMQDFYDGLVFNPDVNPGNAVLLTVDMAGREIYLAGFYKGEERLQPTRLDKVRDKITGDLSSGFYAEAFETFLKQSARYLNFKPSIDPDLFFFNRVFQLVFAMIVAGIVVFVMARHSFRQPVDTRNYYNSARSRVYNQRDKFLYTKTTMQKIQKNSGGGGRGGGSGGGSTGGGHSHSGSRGSF